MVVDNTHTHATCDKDEEKEGGEEKEDGQKRV